jgi:hypothetical protein
MIFERWRTKLDPVFRKGTSFGFGTMAPVLSKGKCPMENRYRVYRRETGIHHIEDVVTK